MHNKNISQQLWHQCGWLAGVSAAMAVTLITVSGANADVLNGETAVFNTVYRDLQGEPVYDCAYEALYGYLIPLDSSQTPKSLTLPSNRDVVIFGVTVQ